MSPGKEEDLEWEGIDTNSVIELTQPSLFYEDMAKTILQTRAEDIESLEKATEKVNEASDFVMENIKKTLLENE